MNLEEKLEAKLGSVGQLINAVLYGIAFVGALACLGAALFILPLVLTLLMMSITWIVGSVFEHFGILELFVGIAFFFCLHKISVWSSRRLLGVANKQNHAGGWLATAMYCNLLFAVGGYVVGLIR